MKVLASEMAEIVNSHSVTIRNHTTPAAATVIYSVGAAAVRFFYPPTATATAAVVLALAAVAAAAESTPAVTASAPRGMSISLPVARP